MGMTLGRAIGIWVTERRTYDDVRVSIQSVLPKFCQRSKLFVVLDAVSDDIETLQVSGQTTYPHRTETRHLLRGICQLSLRVAR